MWLSIHPSSRKSKPQKVPKAVRKQMIEQFHLLPEYMDMLACYQSRIQMNGKQVSLIKIFSPSTADERQIYVRDGVDLDQNPELLLYEAIAGSGGIISIMDKRWPSKKINYDDLSEGIPDKKSKTFWF